MFELLRQRSLLIVENDACGGLQQHAIIVRDLFESPDEDATRLVEQLRFNSRRDQTGDLVVQGLAVDRDFLVHDYQFDGQSLHAPIRVSADQVPDEFDLFRVANAEQNDGRVA